jgi:hypothetical protein
MRVLRLGLLLALASGFAAICIYITGLSDPSVCMYVFTMYYHILFKFYKIFFNFVESNNYCNVTIHTDHSYHLTDEEAESLLSLHDSFQKCVVMFPFMFISVFCVVVAFDLDLYYFL